MTYTGKTSGVGNASPASDSSAVLDFQLVAKYRAHLTAIHTHLKTASPRPYRRITKSVQERGETRKQKTRAGSRINLRKKHAKCRQKR